jgi:hypothetical protein
MSSLDMGLTGAAATSGAQDTVGGTAAANPTGLEKTVLADIVKVTREKLGKGEQLISTIARLKGEQAKMRQDRARIARDLKNATKRKNRLKTRARQLTDADLVEVLQMRAAASMKDGQGESNGDNRDEMTAENTTGEGPDECVEEADTTDKMED